MTFSKRTILVICISLLFVSCFNGTERQKSANELRDDLKTQEQIDPTSYLTVTARINQNNGYVISGSVKNTSSITKFKDAIIAINYLSETNTIIDTKKYVVYKFFEPNSETVFEYRIDPPPGFKNFNIELETAVGVD